uniref:Ig-like domain-containing protein n=1 Tax=Gongylonema pulchrum TaxID=637853 RepID=A0A183CUT9_9BILA
LKLCFAAQQRPRVDPQENTVAEGEPARFRCWVPGDPTARLTWKMKGNGPLPHGAQQHEGILNFASAGRQHAGSYICTASDPEGRKPPVDSPVARLIVRPSNNPVVDPPEQTVKENDPARFRCWVPGNPTAVLRWRRVDGGPLGFGVSDNQGILSISHAQMSDAGEYVCAAQDPDGGAPADSSPARLIVERPMCLHILFEKFSICALVHFLFLRNFLQRCNMFEARQPALPRQEHPRIPQVDPLEQTVNEGDRAQFHCWMPGDPNVRLKWSKADGTSLPHGASDNGAGMLYIPRAQIRHADLYVCSAIDPRGGDPIESVPVELKVEPTGRKQQIGRPEAALGSPQVDPMHQTVEEGDPAQIRCFVPGHPHATLSWRKQDGHLPEEATQQNGVLYIPQTEREDAGNYICSMDDPAGGPPVDSTPARIDVKQRMLYQIFSFLPVQWLLHWCKCLFHFLAQVPQVDPVVQTVDEGAPSRIRCWVEDNPNAELSWSKESGELPHGAVDSRGILSIPETAMEDAGEYICTMHDPHGGSPVHAPPATINVRQGLLLFSTPLCIFCISGYVAFTCAMGTVGLHWSFKKRGGALPNGAYEYLGMLVIEKARLSDAGTYICTSNKTDELKSAPPAVLTVIAKDGNQEVIEGVHGEQDREHATVDYGHGINEEEKGANQEYEHGNNEYNNQEYGENHEYEHGNNVEDEHKENRHEHGKCCCFQFP